jgi:protein tyrosine phosphatase (PTP) superfamily phosphohydrolase (DUF442 family)
MSILNEIPINDLLMTSGQPSAEQLKDIAAEGYSTIINLALPNSKNVLAGEADLVALLGMNYLCIPVDWERPSVEKFDFFATVLQAIRDEKVWVHCALNMRVACFMFLYQVLYLNIEEKIAYQRMTRVWQPNDRWVAFMNEILRQHPGFSPLTSLTERNPAVRSHRWFGSLF